MAVDFNPNAITGLSGFDTKGTVEKLMLAERKKIEPVQKRTDAKKLEVDAWKQVKSYLDAVKTSSTSLAKKSLWEGKLVTSSHPELVEAIATSGAKPGKHTLIVDKLALNHQIASQNFATKDEQIARGDVYIAIGDEPELQLRVDESNDTLQGYVDAINAMDAGVNASIIKTGNKEKPFQVVLTSQKTGREGEIKIREELSGQGQMPSFKPYYSEPSKWQGIARTRDIQKQPTGTGASTAIPELIGTYTGEEPIDLTFTVVNTGLVGVSESLKMRWEDNLGRHGYLDLDSFNYTPGEPIEVVDGISLILSDGELIVNDSFTAKAKNQESDLFWWKSDEERLASITQPSSWDRQMTEGGPIITGTYDSEDDDVFTLRVVGGGQVGQAQDLKIEYESENGVQGTLFVGKGYEPGTKLSLGRGLEISLKPGILQDGDFSTFEYQAQSTADYWWLEESERNEGGNILNLTNWIHPDRDEDEEDMFAAARKKGPIGPRVSDVEKAIVGEYTDFEPKVYTFTAMNSGSVGVTKGLELKWEDNKGNSGTLKVGGDEYQIGQPIEFDSGLSLVLGEGSVFETDSFTFRTFTPVIQPPQDAEIRFGATDLGGGLVITNSTNTLEDVIDGVKLNLLATSEDVVTINIRGDTEKALSVIGEFVESYNNMLLFFKEIMKYDKENNEAAPLQGDRNLPRIQAETNRIFIDPVSGLPADRNLLISVGIKLNRDGLIELDEEKLTNAINDDLSKIANLFRSFGQIDNSGIVFLSANEKTKISGTEGYDINITEAASSGYYLTRPFFQPVEINDENNRIYISINGRESEEIVLENGVWGAEQLAKDIQRKVINDKFLGKMKIAVTYDGAQIRIRSSTTGAKSSVEIRSANEELEDPHPLEGGQGLIGKDVQGMIGGVPMDGSGRILSGREGSDYEGLKLYVSLSENQLNEGNEGNMVVTKGVATKVKEYIEEIMAPETGALNIYTQNVEKQLSGYKREMRLLEERMDVKKQNLIQKFAKLEGKLGQLKSEQNYLTQQLAKI